MAKSIYRKLTGRDRTFLGYSQLWLGPDHILLVKSTRITEQYQRFALGDIQSITITESRNRMPVWIAESAAAMLWMVGFFAFHFFLAKYFFAITGAMALALVIADIARGPRCRCYLTTAVSRELLRPVSRMREAESFIAMVQPAIEAAQGSLPSTMEIAEPAAAFEKPPEVPASNLHLPEIVFALFLLDAALILLALRFPHSDTSGVLPTTFIAEIVLLTVALIQRGKAGMRGVIYGLMLLAIVGIGWDAFEVARNFRSIFSTLVQSPATPEKVMEAFNTASWRHSAWIAAIWRMTAGATGLAASLLGRGSE